MAPGERRAPGGGRGGPPPLMGAGIMSRGLRRATGSSGRALDVEADGDGVAVAVFRFVHLP
jgi:hypothetical protein